MHSDFATVFKINFNADKSWSFHNDENRRFWCHATTNISIFPISPCCVLWNTQL